ncbi:MAG: methionyl-tRNA formyltransferase [Acidimicrobiales bacterium]|jgi:methionyl-tRNA formyltransferase
MALHEAGYEIPLVVSQPDRRRGRGKSLMPSPVKAAAVELGLTVTDEVDDVLEVDADLAVVVAFGRLIKRHVLEQVPMVNLHFSLLPRWRGAAPVERAILAGDETTGVCLMELAEELDAGGIYRVAEVPIASTATLDGLRNELVDIGTSLLLEALANGLGPAAPQVGEVVVAKKIRSDELRLDLDKSADELHRVIRLGGAWLEFRGKRLRLWEAEPVADGPAPGVVVDSVLGTGQGGLELINVQPEGKQQMTAQAWLNGAQMESDERLN